MDIECLQDADEYLGKAAENINWAITFLDIGEYEQSAYEELKGLVYTILDFRRTISDAIESESLEKLK